MNFHSCACEDCEERYRHIRKQFEDGVAAHPEVDGIVLPKAVVLVMLNEWGKLFAKQLPEGATQPEAKA